MNDMVHHDAVVSRAIDVISDIINSQSAEVYIVQNIYGKLMIYLESQNYTLVDVSRMRLLRSKYLRQK